MIKAHKVLTLEDESFKDAPVFECAVEDLRLKLNQQ